MEPRIIGESTVGVNNEDLEKAIERVERSKMYRDLSTIIICPTRGMFPTRVVQSWMKLLRPMNQLVAGPIFAEGIEVGEAYNKLIEYILKNDFLNKFKYVLTIEEDNMPPADGLIKLYESIDEYDAVGGLYWGKGDNGFPMIFGDPEKGIYDSTPQKPIPGKVQRCCALGMGFTLFKLDMFKNIEGELFKTKQSSDPLEGEYNMTQDFFFFRKAAEHGYKFACDNRVLVGHYDSKQDKVW